MKNKTMCLKWYKKTSNSLICQWESNIPFSLENNLSYFCKAGTVHILYLVRIVLLYMLPRGNLENVYKKICKTMFAKFGVIQMSIHSRVGVLSKGIRWQSSNHCIFPFHVLDYGDYWCSEYLRCGNIVLSTVILSIRP